MSITLICLVKGTTIANAFPVHIDKNRLVSDLKKVINAEKKYDFASVGLKLWKVEITGDYDYQLRNLSLKDNEELLAIIDIKEYWPENPPKKSINVIVELPASTIASKEVLELREKVAFYEDMFGGNFYGKLSESSKRQNSVYEEDQERNTKKIKGYPTPSSYAMVSYLRSIQTKDQEFLIGRPYNCVGPPLVLYNPVFSDFKKYYNDEELPIDKNHYQWTLNLVNLMSDFYLNEDGRVREFHSEISTLFNKNVIGVQLEDKTSNDGVVMSNLYNFNILYVLIKIKNEIGTGKCDPTIQAAVSYAKYYIQKTNGRLLKGCNMPCFIIGLAGPWICVLGAVYVEKPIIQPLTAFEPLINTSDRTHIEKIARLFMALYLGYNNLKNYYNSLEISTVNDGDPQRFYPYLRDADNVGEFFYSEKLFDDKLLWKAETIMGGRQIVVKYTHRYNKTAHELCFKIGKAPELFHVEKLTCGFYYVVMEYIEGKRLRECDLKRLEYEKVIQDIEDAIKFLHSRDIVFADLRDSNIMVIYDEVRNEYRGMLVDFDWAGTNDVDKYPPLMNPDINWPTGAQDMALLKKKHDIYWLDFLKQTYLYAYA